MMETNQLLINYYKKEELKKALQRREEGMTLDEIIHLANKEYITPEEIKEKIEYEFGEEENYTKINPDFHNEEKVDNENTIEEDIEEFVLEDDETEKIEGNSNMLIQNKSNEIILIDDENLEDYPEQPFRLYNEDEKKEMRESIMRNGIMQPLIVRPLSNGHYQILAGHNRRACARDVGITQYPCIVKENLTDDEAKIYLIDTNLCTREKISTMERARAYRIKYDLYKKNNMKIKSSMIEEVKNDNLNIRGKFVKEEGISSTNMQRYLRLTYLIPKLQDAMEENKMSIKVGEKVSFLPDEEQEILAKILSERKVKISEKTAQRIRKESEKCRDEDEYNCLSEEKIIDLIMYKTEILTTGVSIMFSKDEVNEYFNEKTVEEIKEYLIELIKSSKV